MSLTWIQYLNFAPVQGGLYQFDVWTK
jgi:hypothetical protein